MLRATSRFERAYRRAQPLLRACAIGAFRDLVAQRHSDPLHWSRRYNTIKGLPQAILEVDIAGGERMLVHFQDDRLTLVDLGSHNVVRHYQRTGNLHAELARLVAVPADFENQLPPGFFTFDITSEWRTYANEADPGWLTYLDAQQAEVVSEILTGIEARRGNPRDWNMSLVLGGPGTGKTSIILSLMEQSFSYDLIPEIIVSDQVAEYIRACNYIDLDPYRTTMATAKLGGHGGLLLIDDPGHLRDVERAKWIAQRRQFQSVVVGLDPLQVEGDPDDSLLINLQTRRAEAHVSLYPLDVCYRQKENVGRAAQRALQTIAASSPFFDMERNRRHREARTDITTLVNNLKFVNPSGRAKVYRAPLIEDVAFEVDDLLRRPGLWRHWPPALLAIDDERRVEIPEAWETEFGRIRNLRRCGLTQIASIRGLEFQYVVLILSSELFEELESGFEGSGMRTYEKRRLYRIPLTRAKDGIIVFVQ